MTRLKAEDQQKAIDECKSEIERLEYVMKYQGLIGCADMAKQKTNLKEWKQKLSNAERMLELIIEGEK